MLRHLALSRPEWSEADRIALVSKAIAAVNMAAKKQPPTAMELHETLRDICIPLLKELGVNEQELEDLKDEDDASF